MKYNKIVLAGGTGYLGKQICRYFADKTDEIVVLCRKIPEKKLPVTYTIWNGKDSGAWTSALDGADLLINLCGKNVNCRYTDANKKAIFQSRLDPTRILGEVISDLKNPPACWINTSSATYYRHAEDRPQDETGGEEGYGFSVEVVKAWEAAFFNSNRPSTRKIALRLGFVLGMTESALPVLLRLVKFGLGGHQGTGQQRMTWIHEQDYLRSLEWLLDHPAADGIYNCTAPNPVTNDHFMRTLRHAYGVPIGLPSPQWLLEIGAWLIGTETELMLKSRWVVPERLLKEGFSFQFPKIEAAIHDLLSNAGESSGFR